jgi:hypothetical protein
VHDVTGPEVDTGPPRPAVLIAGGVLSYLLGIMLGLVGALTIPMGPYVGSVLLSVGVVIAGVGNAVAVRLAYVMTGSRIGAAIPFLGWLTVVLPFGSTRANGSVIITGDNKGFAFLLVGMLSAAVALALTGLPRWRR